MSKHTPGPWEACEPGDYLDFGGNSRVVLGDDSRIAVVHWNGDNKQNSDANARLIAAAPDLLEALSDFSEYVHAEQSSTDGAVRYSNSRIQGLAFKARAAIAKATQ